MSEKVLVPVEVLEKFCLTVLQKAGLSEQDSTTVTESLLCADLRGVGSHGIVRLASYLDRIRVGVMSLNPKMTIERDAPGSALLNAQNGFGQLAGAKAMQIAIEKAKTNGVGLVGVTNSNHFGIAAFFAMQALKEDMIGLVMTNASPAIAPYKTKTPLLGTNPLAVTVPAAAQKPIILDMATSVVARGKIRLASLTGDTIPFGWARDSEGNPTDNPKAALKGSMEPIGGPKGSGLSLIIDLLCGVLTGAGVTGEVKNITDTSGPSKTGHIFIAINVSKFINPEYFKKTVDQVILHIKSLPSSDGSPIYLPGEPELNLEAKRRTEGIPLAVDVISGLCKLADHYGVPKLGLAGASSLTPSK